MKKVDEEIIDEHKEGMFRRVDQMEDLRYKKIGEMIPKGSKVLDIGCAYKQMKPYIDGEYVGLDIYGDPDINGSCYEIPFPDKSFDYAVMSEVIEHLEHPFDAVKEAMRVAHRLIITTPNPYSFPKLIGYFTKLADRDSHTHYINFNAHNLRNLIRACGFNVVDGFQYCFKIPKSKIIPIKSRYGCFHVFEVSK